MTTLMSSVITVISVTSQTMFAFFCAFFVMYLLARLLLPLERSLSKYVWDHSATMKPERTRSSFRAFSQKYRH